MIGDYHRLTDRRDAPGLQPNTQPYFATRYGPVPGGQPAQRVTIAAPAYATQSQCSIGCSARHPYASGAQVQPAGLPNVERHVLVRLAKALGQVLADL